MTIPHQNRIPGLEQCEETSISNIELATLFSTYLGDQLPISLHHAPDSLLRLISFHNRDEILSLQIFTEFEPPFSAVLEGIATNNHIDYDDHADANILDMLHTIKRAYSDGVAVDIVIYNAMRIAYERLGIKLVNSDIVFDFFSMVMTTGNKFHDAILRSRSDTLAQLFAETLIERLN